MAAFLTNAEFVTRYDHRVIGDLVADDGTRKSSSQLATDTNLETALEDASGEILSACLRGGKYSETDLTGLTGNSEAFLKRLTADLAMYFLVCRRGLKVDEYPLAEKARDMLELIEEGQRVFNVAEVIEAGVATTVAISIQDIADQNALRDSVKIFPTRRYDSSQW